MEQCTKLDLGLAVARRGACCLIEIESVAPSLVVHRRVPGPPDHTQSSGGLCASAENAPPLPKLATGFAISRCPAPTDIYLAASSRGRILRTRPKLRYFHYQRDLGR